MDFSTLLTGGALVGLLAGFWGKIKEALLFLVNMVYETVEIGDPRTAQCLLDFLSAKKYSIFRRRYYSASEFYVKSEKKFRYVPYELLGENPVCFWLGRWPIILSKAKSPAKGGANNGGGQQPRAVGESGSSDPSSPSMNNPVVAHLRFFRGTVDVAKLFKAAGLEMEFQSKGKTSHCVIYHRADGVSQYEYRRQFSRWTGPFAAFYSHGLDAVATQTSILSAESRHNLSGVSDNNGRSLDHLYYPDYVRDLIEEAKYWATAESWYRDKGLAWKRGWLLYGPAGTGKTALARALSMELDVPLHVFSLINMTDSMFLTHWQNMNISNSSSDPKVVLFEDFDTVFHGRENQSKGVSAAVQRIFLGGKNGASGDSHGELLNFDTLLNALDGIEKSNGVFLIVTTNDVTKIDPAMGTPCEPNNPASTTSTRPGRIDRTIYLGPMRVEDRKEMARHMLAEFPDTLEAMLTAIDCERATEVTPAQFQERCASLALTLKMERNTSGSRQE